MGGRGWLLRDGGGEWGGGRKRDGVVGGVRGGGAKRGTNHLINVGNSQHIFVASSNKLFLKIAQRHK